MGASPFFKNHFIQPEIEFIVNLETAFPVDNHCLPFSREEIAVADVVGIDHIDIPVIVEIWVEILPAWDRSPIQRDCRDTRWQGRQHPFSELSDALVVKTGGTGRARCTGGGRQYRHRFSPEDPEVPESRRIVICKGFRPVNHLCTPRTGNAGRSPDPRLKQRTGQDTSTHGLLRLSMRPEVFRRSSGYSYGEFPCSRRGPGVTPRIIVSHLLYAFMDGRDNGLNLLIRHIHKDRKCNCPRFSRSSDWPKSLLRSFPAYRS